MNRENMNREKQADKNKCWRNVDDELPVIKDGEEGEEPFLGLFWDEDQELLYDDDNTKYDENGLVLGFVYYYGNNIWKTDCWEKAFVKYWLPIPYRPEQKIKNKFDNL